MLYIGTGPAQKGDPMKSDARPMAFGFLYQSNSSDAVFGLDIGLEGTMLDSTWGQNNAVTQSTSYNLLVGTKVLGDADSRLDLVLLLGLRQETASCPASDLGYQCYADREPKRTYTGNFGVELNWSRGAFMVGLRAAPESRQAMLGVRF